MPLSVYDTAARIRMHLSLHDQGSGFRRVSLNGFDIYSMPTNTPKDYLAFLSVTDTFINTLDNFPEQIKGTLIFGSKNKDIYLHGDVKWCKELAISGREHQTFYFRGCPDCDGINIVAAGDIILNLEGWNIDTTKPMPMFAGLTKYFEQISRYYNTQKLKNELLYNSNDEAGLGSIIDII